MGKRTVSNSNQSYLQRLVESLDRIAASADAQIAWMNKTGFPPEGREGGFDPLVEPCAFSCRVEDGQPTGCICIGGSQGIP